MYRVGIPHDLIKYNLLSTQKSGTQARHTGGQQHIVLKLFMALLQLSKIQHYHFSSCSVSLFGRLPWPIGNACLRHEARGAVPTGLQLHVPQSSRVGTRPLPPPLSSALHWTSSCTWDHHGACSQPAAHARPVPWLPYSSWNSRSQPVNCYHPPSRALPSLSWYHLLKLWTTDASRIPYASLSTSGVSGRKRMLACRCSLLWKCHSYSDGHVFPPHLHCASDGNAAAKWHAAEVRGAEKAVRVPISWLHQAILEAVPSPNAHQKAHWGETIRMRSRGLWKEILPIRPAPKTQPQALWYPSISVWGLREKVLTIRSPQNPHEDAYWREATYLHLAQLSQTICTIWWARSPLGHAQKTSWEESILKRTVRNRANQRLTYPSL